MERIFKKIRKSAKAVSIACKIITVFMCVFALLTLISAVWLTVDPSGEGLKIGGGFLLRSPISIGETESVKDATAELYGQVVMYIFLILIMLNVENMFARISADGNVFTRAYVRVLRKSAFIMFVMSIIVPCVESIVSKVIGGSGNASGYGAGLFAASFLLFIFSSLYRNAVLLWEAKDETDGKKNGETELSEESFAERDGIGAEDSESPEMTDGKQDGNPSGTKPEDSAPGGLNDKTSE